MKITARGILNHGEPGTSRAIAHFPSPTVLDDGTLLVAYCVGSMKDSADEDIELRRSHDLGESWSSPWTPFATTVQGTKGGLKLAHLTPLSPDRLLAAALWIDRQTYPGKPTFHEKTQGCLPMKILIAESADQGNTWSSWRVVDTLEDINPPGLTNPILRLPSGRLAISIESNKHYEDTSVWKQRVTYMYSEDSGHTWGQPTFICGDPSGRFFHWDQRAGMAPDGSIVTFTWMYDSKTETFRNFERRLSHDEGKTWTVPEDMGVRDQPSVPAIFPDGRMAVAWVDRYVTQTIRIRMAERFDGPLLEETEVILWDQKKDSHGRFYEEGDPLGTTGAFTYGLPFAHALPNGEAMVVYYGGDLTATNVYWARLSL